MDSQGQSCCARGGDESKQTCTGSDVTQPWPEWKSLTNANYSISGTRSETGERGQGVRVEKGETALIYRVVLSSKSATALRAPGKTSWERAV